MSGPQQRRYPPEVRDRVVTRLQQETEAGTTRAEAISRVASETGVTRKSVRQWGLDAGVIQRVYSTGPRVATVHTPTIAGSLVATARRKTGLTVRDFAHRVGYKASVVSAWERGDRHPTMETVDEVLRRAGFSLTISLDPLPEGGSTVVFS